MTGQPVVPGPFPAIGNITLAWSSHFLLAQRNPMWEHSLLIYIAIANRSDFGLIQVTSHTISFKKLGGVGGFGCYSLRLVLKSNLTK